MPNTVRRITGTPAPVARHDTNPHLAEYRNLTEGGLAIERDRLVEALDADHVSEETLARADAVQTVTQERESAATRRADLAALVAAPGGLPPIHPQVRSLFTAYGAQGNSGKIGRTIETRALMVGDTGAPTGWAPIAGQPMTPTGLLDLLPPIFTGEGMVEYLRDETPLETNPAAVVPEGDLKPEAVADYTLQRAVTETIAVWKAATRQWVEDVPGGQAYLVTRLRDAVRARLAVNAVATVTGADGILTPTAASTVEAIVRVSTALRRSGYAPQAVVIHPDDEADMLLDTDDNGAWLGLPPGASLPRVVTDPAVTPGQVIAFDPNAVRLLVRTDVDLRIADQHADMFLRNTLVMLAETRAVTVVMQPRGVAVATVGAPEA